MVASSAFGVPYDSFRKQPMSTDGDGSVEIIPSADLGSDIKSRELDYEFYCFFLSSQRLDLYKSLDYRCEDMLLGTDGLLSEAKHLLDLGLLPNSNSASRAIGYRQAMEYLLMCRSLGDASSTGAFYSFLSNFQKASRNFAKRQLTWFRNEQIYHWVDASKPLEKVLDFIYEAYHDKSENVVVPDLLKMRKETTHREGAALKAYRTRNRHFVKREDCSEILQWVTETQCERMSEV